MLGGFCSLWFRPNASLTPLLRREILSCDTSSRPNRIPVRLSPPSCHLTGKSGSANRGLSSSIYLSIYLASAWVSDLSERPNSGGRLVTGLYLRAVGISHHSLSPHASTQGNLRSTCWGYITVSPGLATNYSILWLTPEPPAWPSASPALHGLLHGPFHLPPPGGKRSKEELRKFWTERARRERIRLEIIDRPNRALSLVTRTGARIREGEGGAGAEDLDAFTKQVEQN
jgi:hypothetical protein